MTSIGLRPVEAGDVEWVAERMRADDVAELDASCGLAPLDALRRSVEVTPHALTAVVDGEPAAIFGVAPTDEPTTGVIWLLGTPRVTASPSAFLRTSRATVRTLAAPYARVFNLIDARYTAARRWLRHLGFRETGHIVRGTGPGRLPLIAMERLNDV